MRITTDSAFVDQWASGRRSCSRSPVHESANAHRSTTGASSPRCDGSGGFPAQQLGQCRSMEGASVGRRGGGRQPRESGASPRSFALRDTPIGAVATTVHDVGRWLEEHRLRRHTHQLMRPSCRS